MTKKRHPITEPLDLHGDDLRRYEQVRILRRFIDPTGETPVIIGRDGTVRKGHHRDWKPIDTSFVDQQNERERRSYAKRKQNAFAGPS